MKRIVFAFLIGTAIISCSKKPVDPNTENSVLQEEPSAKPEVTNEQTVSAAEEGKQLIERLNCLTCHKQDAKLIGPSYQDIAAKYTEADIDMLADKIINGGVGVWGQVPMTPHAGLSKENAKKMVEYILTLKK